MSNVKKVRNKRSVNEINPEMCQQDDGTQVEEPKKTKKKGNRKKTVRKHTVEEPVGKNAYSTFIKNSSKLGVQGLLQEFEGIKAVTQAIGATPKTFFDANPDKNRYKDVYCVDESRVPIKWPEGQGLTDYIHANYVTTDDDRKYICTQGPTDKTIEDFWRMVWQEKAGSIVMLCNVLEGAAGALKKKCEQYWPENVGDTMTPPPTNLLKITVKAKENFDKNVIQTTLVLTAGKETLQVEHFQWVNWPDRGVPTDAAGCLKLYRAVKKLSPTVIHCSAGIGRTGTIVAIDIIHTRLLGGKDVTLKEAVMELRKARHGSVQMAVQYVFILRVLIEYACNFRTHVTPADAADFTAQYEKYLVASGFANH